MSAKNFECKARCADIAAAEATLLIHNPLFIGEDNQCDTYFQVPHGRLKLREGNIENALIHYERQNTANAKLSQVILYQHRPDANLKAALTAALGIKVVVRKKRRIYFIDNVKFHFDTLEGLGQFLEIEVIDRGGELPIETLQAQFAHYAAVLGIAEADYVAGSYSDMLLANSEKWMVDNG
jgi:adenylate cyclase, class 2